jgi:hypothetical protein
LHWKRWAERIFTKSCLYIWKVEIFDFSANYRNLYKKKFYRNLVKKVIWHLMSNIMSMWWLITDEYTKKLILMKGNEAIYFKIELKFNILKRWRNKNNWTLVFEQSNTENTKNWNISINFCLIIKLVCCSLEEI